MKEIRGIVVGVLLGGGIGMLFSHTISCYVPVIMLAAGLLGLLWVAWDGWEKQLWPDRSFWSAQLLNNPVHLIGREATDWRTDTDQRVGDTFYLDIRKESGKTRVIDQIRFVTGRRKYNSEESPLRYSVSIVGETGFCLNGENGSKLQGHLMQHLPRTFLYASDAQQR